MALSGSSDILSFSFDNVLPGKYKGEDSLPEQHVTFLTIVVIVIVIFILSVLVIFHLGLIRAVTC